jgi:hypothetical protein
MQFFTVIYDSQEAAGPLTANRLKAADAASSKNLPDAQQNAA